ncbi:endo alpha-1,4 polygalactosaminidase [Microbacterium sp.]|uniref:endo alpha-1,4 polygalactosaminidase n=1 Tax=Microbacterium sp. TaxID=51671 RepID=UPI0028114DAC|nr:endo alpha-1,4 polygalactosaminidase [Microbacterium sp.]
MLLIAASVAVACAVAGCAGPAPACSRPPDAAAVTVPDAAAGFDYQLGGAYDPPEGATVVVRDRLVEPAGAGYDICYVNGFQTQPDASAQMAEEHPELIVHVDGEPLADPGWPDELLFDTSSAAKRDALIGIVGPWIAGCGDAGYAAVEIDNLDSYTRSEGRLTLDDNMALAAEYARLAHEEGLAIAQKNTAEQSRRLAEMGYDFAITESCHRFDECDAYSDVYEVVLDIEYDDELGSGEFAEACAESSRPTTILRDHDLLTPEEDGYVYRACPRPDADAAGG